MANNQNHTLDVMALCCETVVRRLRKAGQKDKYQAFIREFMEMSHDPDSSERQLELCRVTLPEVIQPILDAEKRRRDHEGMAHQMLLFGQDTEGG